jgi:hypothetical protein
MTKLEYLRRLHDLAYAANLADTDRAEPWQRPDMAHRHAQALLDIVSDILTPAEYDAFLDFFGDFASFAVLLERADA